ncbi:MAG: protein translocase subunit SecF [Peptococcaceae bacterium]|nr:protein translocase subunit SecF [Peptococcaceae bacterium]
MDFVGKRKIWYLISGVVLLAGLGSLVFRGLNLGIDFQSGTLMQLRMDDTSVTQEQLREALGAFDLERSNINLGDDLSFTIKSVELDQERQTQVLDGVRESLGDFDLRRVETVGPVIGAELTRAAIWALVLVFAMIIVYVSIRFQLKMALAAILTLVHDSLVMLGFFSIFQWEVESYFIAAVLTIIGYSINDTIVIFDRVRENLKGRRRDDLKTVINNSISQTVGRSVNMSLVVMFVLLALIFFGGETTRVFAIALLIGNFAGFYSTLVVAGPLWYDLRPRERRD